jgi:hypothetical protein
MNIQPFRDQRGHPEAAAARGGPAHHRVGTRPRQRQRRPASWPSRSSRISCTRPARSSQAPVVPGPRPGRCWRPGAVPAIRGLLAVSGSAEASVPEVLTVFLPSCLNVRLRRGRERHSAWWMVDSWGQDPTNPPSTMRNAPHLHAEPRRYYYSLASLKCSCRIALLRRSLPRQRLVVSGGGSPGGASRLGRCGQSG